MKVKIRKVADNANHEEERLILDVVEDTDIGKYVVFDTSYSSTGSISNKVRHTFWFPDKEVKKGDLVVLYTKKGKSTSEKKEGYTVHFFYWNLDISVWNNEGDAAVLLYCSEWEAKKVK